MSIPSPSKFFSSVPAPGMTPETQQPAFEALKSNVEVLTRQRKPIESSAVLWQELIDLGLVSASGSGGSTFITITNPGREVLTANRTYFVSNSGNDLNPGTTIGSPFLTIQHAVDVAVALDLSIFSVTINVAPGTYNEMVILKSYVGKGPISIVGDPVTPANVHIAMSGAGDPIRAGQVLGPYSLSGLKLSALTAGFNCIRAADATTLIQISNIEFGVANIHASAQFAATIRNGGGTRIVGNAGFHYYADNGGTIVDAGTTTTLVGAITFGQYARIIQQARFICNVAVGVTPFVGTATGLKFSLDTGGMIFTGGQGPGFLPGSVTPAVPADIPTGSIYA